jgi:hypothetical protein
MRSPLRGEVVSAFTFYVFSMNVVFEFAGLAFPGRMVTRLARVSSIYTLFSARARADHTGINIQLLPLP